MTQGLRLTKLCTREHGGFQDLPEHHHPAKQRGKNAEEHRQVAFKGGYYDGTWHFPPHISLAKTQSLGLSDCRD